MNIVDLPYNQHLGLQTETSGDGEILSLQPDSRHLNHLGTIHASAIFSLAEAASGHAILLQFPHLKESALAVLREAQIKYRRPATGTIRAIGEIGDREATAFRERFESKGRGTIQVSIRVLQGEGEVFIGTYSWFASRSV